MKPELPPDPSFNPDMISLVTLNQERIPELTAKLDEYNKRLKKQKEDTVIIDEYKILLYKMEFLKALLDNGKIDSEGLRKIIPLLLKEFPKIDFELLYEAFTIIKSYNNSGGTDGTIIGGTGLPRV